MRSAVELELEGDLPENLSVGGGVESVLERQKEQQVGVSRILRYRAEFVVGR